MYPGRVFLGLGTGEAVNELAAGGGWGPYAEREARLREAIALIRRLWSGEFISHEGAFTVSNAKIYTRPAEPISIYVAASGPKSAALAGELSDGWITDGRTFLERPAVRRAFDGARRGRDVPILIEQYVFVGDEAEALEAARLWLFAPVADQVIAMDDPRAIQRLAEERSPPERVIESWLISRDPQPHIDRLRALFEAGASHVAVHSAQEDQERCIAFYGQQVLPALRLEGVV
jgi:alkanesulfonate monooxygenase SsuD/methylene tetrahydromethanopterin reductase-like flavin-dependent oxidoreductase (luciferase family)